MRQKTFQMLLLLLLFIVAVPAGSQTAKKPGGTQDSMSAKKETSYNTDKKFYQLSIRFYCLDSCYFEAYLIDPLGRKLGYDALSHAKFNEIPFADYSGLSGVESLFDNADREFSIIWAETGDYQIILANTISGKCFRYKMVVNDISIEDIWTGPYIIRKFLFHADAENKKHSFVSGGFDGGGQRPNDVNKFLTYASPSESHTELPSGTATFPLMIFYGKDIITTTFKTSLNGVDITSLFHPNAGNYETINLQISSGRNVLILSVDGNLEKQVATDTDRLVFIVKQK